MIKPCPFCGNKESPKLISFNEMAELYDNHDSDDDGYFIICDASDAGCGATSGFGETKKAAIALWNIRTRQIDISQIY